MVGRRPAHRGGRGLDDQHRAQVRLGRDLVSGQRARRHQERIGAGRHQARAQILPPGRADAREPRAVLRAAPAHLGETCRNEGVRPQGVLPAEGTPDGLGRPLRGQPVPGQGHDGLQAQPVLLRAEVPVGGRDAHVLHEPHLNDRRLRGRQPRLHRQPALHRGQHAQGPPGRHAQRVAGQRGDQSRLQLQSEEAEEPRTAQPEGQAGARVRDAAQADHRRRLRRARAAVGQPHVGVLGPLGLGQSRREAAPVRPGEGQADPRRPGIQAPARGACGRCRRRPGPTRSPRTR